MTQIITITPNPAIDVSTTVEKMTPFGKLRCAAPRRDPGGGGINVARVVNRLGGNVTAVYPTGGATGQLLRALMDREGVGSLTIPTQEETREDFTVFETAKAQQFRFVMPGAPLRTQEWQQCLAGIKSMPFSGQFIVAIGSLPPGVPDDFVAQVSRIANGVNARMIVDTSGPPLKAALKKGVYLIKPNLREFRELTSVCGNEIDALVAAGRELILQKRVTIVALSLGPDGALLITRDCALKAEGPAIKPVSVVGAGDSFLGALVWSLARDGDIELALRYGVAAGSAAVLNTGTELCKRHEVERLVRKIAVRRVGLDANSRKADV